MSFQDDEFMRRQRRADERGRVAARIAALEGELGLLLEYFERGIPYWFGTSPVDRIRAVLTDALPAAERDLMDMQRIARERGICAVESVAGTPWWMVVVMSAKKTEACPEGILYQASRAGAANGYTREQVLTLLKGGNTMKHVEAGPSGGEDG